MARLTWITVTVLGLAAGGFVFHFPGSYGSFGFDAAAGLFGLILGAINGVLAGALVWVGLRLPRPEGMRAIAAMALMVGGTHALNDGTSSRIPFLIVEAVAGLMAAGVAAWILRVRRAPVLAVTGIAWTVGIVLAGWSGNLLGLPLSETPIGWSMDHAWEGLIAGLVWGSATAAAGLPMVMRDGSPGPGNRTTRAG